MPVKTTAAASGTAANARTSSSMARSVRRGRQRPRQRADVVVEEREVVGGRGHASDRGRELQDERIGPAGEQLRRLLRLERLVHDYAYLLIADRCRELGEPRRARRHSFLDLDHVDDIEAES